MEELAVPGVCQAPSTRNAAVLLPRGCETMATTPCPPSDTAPRAKGQKHPSVKLEDSVRSVQNSIYGEIIKAKSSYSFSQDVKGWFLPLSFFWASTLHFSSRQWFKAWESFGVRGGRGRAGALQTLCSVTASGASAGSREGQGEAGIRLSYFKHAGADLGRALRTDLALQALFKVDKKIVFPSRLNTDKPAKPQPLPLAAPLHPALLIPSLSSSASQRRWGLQHQCTLQKGFAPS